MDIGEPIMSSDPTSEASLAYAHIAERIHKELGPKRIYKSDLRIDGH
jgi:hypothetical protein